MESRYRVWSTEQRGVPALKVHGKLLACIPINRSAEPDYMVLVRLSRVSPDVLRDLLGMAHKFVTRNTARRCARLPGNAQSPDQENKKRKDRAGPQ